MVNKLTKKSILKAKELIDSYGKEMAKLKEKIDAIDEKYRKMAEEARKDLALEYATLEAEQEIWQSSLSLFDVDDVNEVLGEFESSSTIDDDNTDEQAGEVDTTAPEEAQPEVESISTEEVITDTIFPENNVEENNDSPSQEAEELNEIWPEEGNDEAPATPEESISPEEMDALAKDGLEPVTEEAEAEADAAQENEWPDFPQEW